MGPPSLLQKKYWSECLSHPSTPTQDRYKHFQSLLPYLEKELQKVDVTRQLLWQEYKQQYPGGYNHTQFCHYLRLQKKSHQVSMLQTQKAGNKLYRAAAA